MTDWEQLMFEYWQTEQCKDLAVKIVTINFMIAGKAEGACLHS